MRIAIDGGKLAIWVHCDGMNVSLIVGCAGFF